LWGVGGWVWGVGTSSSLLVFSTPVFLFPSSLPVEWLEVTSLVEPRTFSISGNFFLLCTSNCTSTPFFPQRAVMPSQDFPHFLHTLFSLPSQNSEVPTTPRITVLIVQILLSPLSFSFFFFCGFFVSGGFRLFCLSTAFRHFLRMFPPPLIHIVFSSIRGL